MDPDKEYNVAIANNGCENCLRNNNCKNQCSIKLKIKGEMQKSLYRTCIKKSFFDVESCGSNISLINSNTGKTVSVG